MNFEIKGNLISFYSSFFFKKKSTVKWKSNKRISLTNVSIERNFKLIIIFLCFDFFFSFIAGGKTPDFASRTYTQIMREQMLQGEETEVRTKTFFLIHSSKLIYQMINFFYLFIFLAAQKNSGKIQRWNTYKINER